MKSISPIFTTSLLLFYAIVFSTTYLTAQQTIEFLVFDLETKNPVPSANVFQANSTYGTYSEANGQVLLKSPIKEDILISHVSYEAKILEYTVYSQLSIEDTVWLQPYPIIIDELVVTAKRGSKWKKRFKKFKKGFLGDDKIAKKTTILNPEVLRFEEEDGVLYVTGVDLLNIENPHLGYKINYWLNYYKEETDGSIEYIGKAKFTPYTSGDFDNKRKEIYKHSPKHFFKNLIDGQMEEAGYIASLHNMIEAEDIQYESPPLNELLKPTEEGHYQLYFPDFLKVVNNNITNKTVIKGVKISSVEAQKFGSAPPSQTIKREAVISYIYKLSPFLLLNKYGNILNTKVVKEYGYWADQRIAHQLPFEYGNDYANSTPSKVATENEFPQEQDIDKHKIFSAILYEGNSQSRLERLNTIADNWDLSYVAPLVDLIRMSTDDKLNTEIIKLLNAKTNETNRDYYTWLQWLWSEEPQYSSDYPELKALMHEHVDPKFKNYFKGRADQANIRLDEIVWGGVIQDGIPPLRYPKMIKSNEASYLEGSNVVFGIYINGIARAYPKRILAWHEFFVDDFGDTSIAGVYCTLCGTMIAYDQQEYQLGTSGFLYRSNKLMYDKETQSLWSTIEGKPVVGPLVNKGIELASHPVVTTTWVEWKKQHPATEVLSLSTGHNRNYDEGEAYKNYYATDELMFPVPHSDDRLLNKEEVLIIRTEEYRKDPTAISIRHLNKNPLVQLSIHNQSIIVITDKQGLTKAYDAGRNKFKSYKKGILNDKQGNKWTIEESKLCAMNGEELQRIPTHNIFWFAWVNQYPETKLIK